MAVRKPDSTGDSAKRGAGRVSSASGKTRYTVAEELGRGGMGTVYGAWDRTLQTKVAVKCPHPGVLQDREFLARFENEVRSLVKLSHPHIVSILDTGQHRGLPFVVMQYLGGGSLEDRVAAPLSRAERIAGLRTWLPAIAGALDFIHGKGFIHRDVKPGNVLFDKDGHAYLGDFSIARVSYAAVEEGGSTRLTQTGIVMGTPEYMAPELALAQTYNGSVDQYALAVTVFEFLCGQPPYKGATPAAVLIDQGSRDVPLIHQSVPWLTQESSLVLARAMARDRWERFATCRNFADAFLAALPPRTGTSLEQADEDVAAEVLPPSGDGPLLDTQPHAAGTEPHVKKSQRQVSPVRSNLRRLTTRITSQHVVIVLLALIVAIQLVSLAVNRSASDESIDSTSAPLVAQATADQHPDAGGTAFQSVPSPQLANPEETRGSAETLPLVRSTATNANSTLPSSSDVSQQKSMTAQNRGRSTVSGKPTTENTAGKEAADPVSVITNSIGMTLRLIPSGQFLMGSSPASSEFVSVFGSDVTELQHESPIHAVTLRPFYLGMHEVTLEQFQTFWSESDYASSLPAAEIVGTGFDPAIKQLSGPQETFQWHRTGFVLSDRHPVTNVSWDDAVAFCHWLSRREGVVYRLPTEAEWEYACRAASPGLFHHGNTLTGLNQTSNVADVQTTLAVPASQVDGTPISELSDGAVFTAPVGTYGSNRLQLHDMHGNVAEWCMDWYAADYYASSPGVNPLGPLRGTQRVVRGGSWLTSPKRCRSASRTSRRPGSRECTIGFRVVRELEPAVKDPQQLSLELEQVSASWPPAASQAAPDNAGSTTSRLSAGERPLPPVLLNRDRFQMLTGRDHADVQWQRHSPGDQVLVQYSVVDISERQGLTAFRWKATTTHLGDGGAWTYLGTARTIRVRVAAVNADGLQSEWSEWQCFGVISSGKRTTAERDAEKQLQRGQFHWATEHVDFADDALW